jgi:hypothetical protein
VIIANGDNSVLCGNSDCAIHADAVYGDPSAPNDGIRLEMDNTARIYVSYDGGTNWTSF